MKSNLVKKRIGDRVHVNPYTPPPMERIVERTKEIIVRFPEVIRKVVRESSYTTNDESIIVIKDINYCTLFLDSTKCKSLKIKSLTKVLIKPIDSLIDGYYEDMLIEKGACVELEFIDDSWYILSSDGLKLE